MKRLFVILAMLTTLNASAQWVQMSNGIPSVSNAFSLAVIGNTIFAGLDFGRGVYKSSNDGLNWTQTALNNRQIITLLAVGNYLYAGTDSGIFVTSNNGTSWTHSSINGIPILSFTANGNTIFAGTNNYGVYVSSNNGNTWVQTTLNNKYVSSLTVFNNIIFAGTTGAIYVSTNNGVDWSSIPNTFGQVLSFAIIGNTILGGIANYPTGYGGIKMSTNNGTNWSYTPFQEETVFALTAYNNKLFSGTSISGIFYSSNLGTNWLAINQGLPTTIVKSLLITNNYIFAATAGTSIWRRSLSEIIGIQNISTETPSKYSLSQNYPNPFNPTTNIKFSIVNSGDVKLVVYDIQGREVRTLVNESLKPGTYEAAFDASVLNSGVYFYKLVTGNFTETKKMLLIK
jgi:Secretion system C-terminal sorting domain